MPEKKKMSRPRKALLIICCVVLALAAAAVAIWFQQSYQANKIYSQAAEDYLIPLGDENSANGNDAEGTGGSGGGSESGGGSGSGGSGSDSDYSLADFAVDWDSLWAVNPDVCAWIRIPAIPTISYPVIHYTDNDYYLRRSWQGTYLVAGCIMEDYHCSPDFSDFHTILYGHNMTSGSMAGTMFGQLKKFQDQSFYEANDDRVIIYTPERTLYYTIFSVHVVDPNDPGVYLVGEFTRDQAFDFVENLRNASDYDTGVWADGDDQILTLSTCSGVTSSKRLTVHAKLTTEVSMTAADDSDDTEDAGNAPDDAEGVENE